MKYSFVGLCRDLLSDFTKVIWPGFDADKQQLRGRARIHFSIADVASQEFAKQLGTSFLTHVTVEFKAIVVNEVPDEEFLTESLNSEVAPKSHDKFYKTPTPTISFPSSPSAFMGDCLNPALLLNEWNAFHPEIEDHISPEMKNFLLVGNPARNVPPLLYDFQYQTVLWMLWRELQTIRKGTYNGLPYEVYDL